MMEIKNSLSSETGRLRLEASGECPYCRVISLFIARGSTHYELIGHRPGSQDEIAANVAQCQNCQEFLLVVGRRNAPESFTPFRLVAIHPVGQADERVDASVPQDVAEDFREAVRCHWAKSYRACVLMCRRAIQSSAGSLKAQGDNLKKQIDDLCKNGIITEPLKDFAHEIRLVGNVGAHPDELRSVEEKDASDMMAFMRQYLEHVYIMPAKLRARTSAPKPAKKP